MTSNNGVGKCVYRSTIVGRGWWLRTNAGIPWPVLLPSNEPSSVLHQRGIWPSSQQLSTRPLLRAPTETNKIHIYHQIHIKNKRNQAIRYNENWEICRVCIFFASNFTTVHFIAKKSFWCKYKRILNSFFNSNFSQF